MSEENVKIIQISLIILLNGYGFLILLMVQKILFKGTGNYAMHLALNFKQNPYLGIVLIPEKDELWITDGKSMVRKKDGQG